MISYATKEVEEFYVENCKTVRKEIEDDSKKRYPMLLDWKN